MIQTDRFADFIVIHIHRKKSASVRSYFLFVIQNLNTVHLKKCMYTLASLEKKE